MNPPVKSGKRLFLIDGSSFCYRAFYAIRSLSTSKGQPTNAVYGVAAMLRKLVEEEKPDGLAVAFDLPKPTFRHRKFEAYKVHRKPMPDPLVDQIPWIKDLFRAYRIPVFELEGYEADDVLATLALQAAGRGFEVFLVTGDKDFLQMVGEKIKVYRPGREGAEILDEQALKERLGIGPAQVVEMMALMGDDTDGIPGIPGIGEKTALDLIQRYGTVEKLLKAIEEGSAVQVRPSVQKAVREHTDGLQLNRELVTVDTAVPLSVNWDELEVQQPDVPALRRIFQTLEFRKLAQELPSEETGQPLEVEILDSAAELKRLLPEIRKSGRAAWVVSEAGVGLAWKEGTAAAVAGPFPVKEFKPLLESPDLVKICPNLKEFWIRLLPETEVRGQGPLFDIAVASYLLDATRPSHALPDLALEMLGRETRDPDPLRSAARQAEAALGLAARMEPELREKELEPLMAEVEVPLAKVLARMESCGIAVDLRAFEDLSRQIQKELDRLTREIYQQAGEEFNLNSPRQMGVILFEKLKLPVIKRTKTGPSTDEEVLRRLSLMHEFPKKILEYRELSKLSSTYVEALPRLVREQTGRIHASFNQTVTATGRLSSSNPNLQNIPIRTELGRQIRRGFVASAPDGVLLTADYSQIELRILAHLSEDAQMMGAFRNGEDIHCTTASEIFHCKPADVGSRERSIAKTINFGVVYGMTAFGLSKELGIGPAEADDFIQRYFTRYPGVRQYLDRSLEETRRRGYCLTLFQRRRNIPELTAKEITVRQFAERIAINAPIQGSAADLIKIAMVQIDASLQQRGLESRMVCQVHDELIFDVPGRELDDVKVLVEKTMEAPLFRGEPVRLRVPIQVNLRSGRNWYEASHD